MIHEVLGEAVEAVLPSAERQGPTWNTPIFVLPSDL